MFGARKVRKASSELEYRRQSLQFDDKKNGHNNSGNGKTKGTAMAGGAGAGGSAGGSATTGTTGTTTHNTTGTEGSSSVNQRRRRRNEFVTKGPPKILPLYIQAATPSVAALAAVSSASCHSFLLGGQYYPGKDKKVRQMRRRTLWYRLFCSSTRRQAISVLALCYIMLWHVMLPFLDTVYDYGLLLSSGYRHVGLQVPQTTLKLPEMSWEKNMFRKIQTLHQADHQLSQTRSELLNHMVPQWFHRNDMKKKTATKTKQKQKTKKQPQKENKIPKQTHQQKHLHKTASAAIGTTAIPEPPPIITQLSTDPPTAKATDPPSERTLQTMDYFPNLSQCPDSADTTINTTLVMQCSLDRLWILSETCKRWKDPIVMVVHLSQEQVHQNKTATLRRQWRSACPQMTLIGYEAQQSEQEWGYPVNKLRNVGLDTVQTSHILIADVDFVPSMNLHDTIRQILEERAEQHEVTNSTLKDRDAIVVPAFERILTDPCHTISECSTYLKFNSDFIPKTLKSLKNCIQNNHCSVFQGQVNWEGHHSTNSKGWLKERWYESNEIILRNGTVSKPIKKVECFDSLRYEPYVVLRWCPHASPSTTEKNQERKKQRPLAPYYDERFYGYGKNKIEMISHLRLLGYQFSILPRGFIVHNPHPESLAKKTWLDVKDYKLHENMDALYPQFLRELWQKYEGITDSNIIVRQCSHK